MSEQPTGLDIDLILQSLKFMRMKIENTKYHTYELRQEQLQGVDTALAQVRARQLSSLDTALILESLEDTRLNFEKTEYPTDEFKQQQLQRVDNALAQVRALRDELRKAQSASSE